MSIAVIGATGLAGQEILNALAERQHEASGVAALASRASAGTEVSFGARTLKAQPLENFNFKGVKATIFAAGPEVAKAHAPRLGQDGIICIDLSPAFRFHPQVPLIVPEVNLHQAQAAKMNILALPGAASAARAAVLKPLMDEARILSAISTVLQPVGEAGKPAMDELFTQTRGIFVGDAVESGVLPKQIAFNLIPQTGEIGADGHSADENAALTETRKILDPDFALSVTSVRAPVFSGTSEALRITFETPVAAARVKAVLRSAPGLVLMDRAGEQSYVTPVEASGEHAIYVGRVRQDPIDKSSVLLWIVSDELRKGAALNAVVIAEAALQHKLKASAP